jgi:hypothetical protein
MMNRIALFAAAAAAFGLSPLTTKLGPVLGSAALVTIGVVLALAASGAPNAIAVASGAVGAFAGGVLLGLSPAAAGGVLVGFCYLERTLRVRGASARAAHVAVALVGGALAGALSAHYLVAGITVRLVVIVVAAVLVALPLLVEADEPMAHALDEIADEVSDPAAKTLREGAELCRTVDASMLDRSSEAQARKTWRSLLRLANARVRLERTHKQRPARAHGEAVAQRLDAKLAKHVEVLARMYTAADEAKAAEMSLDDAPMRSVEDRGESLEQMSRAIVEDIDACEQPAIDAMTQAIAQEVASCEGQVDALDRMTAVIGDKVQA